jgi:hypothetical protein
MYKVVINGCYGGWGLSQAALTWLHDHGSPHVVECSFRGLAEISNGIPRHDPLLVEVVERLGPEVNTNLSELEIVTIDSDRYRIVEYDGLESVETPESVRYVEIPPEMRVK